MNYGFKLDEDVGSTGMKRSTGWSAVGMLTRETEDNVVTLQQNFDEAGTYTVQFTVSPADAVVPVDGARARRVEADIFWRVGGNTLKRTITVAESSSIQGNADGVLIIVRDATQPTMFPDNSQYQVVITIARGTRAPTTPPIFQGDSVINVNGGDTEEAIVPQGIGVTSILMAMTQSGGIFIPPSSTFANEKLAGAGNALFTFDPVVYEWIPLVPGTARVTLTNMNAFAVQASVLWGIDG